MSTILVSGATGFIGKNLVKGLLQKEYKVIITLNEDEKNPFNEAVTGFIIKPESLEETINTIRDNNIDGVIHLASFVQADQHESKDIIKLIYSNILFATQVLDCAVKAKVKWLINTGTYWQNYQNAVYSPVNLYAATKQAFEDIAKYYIETNQIKFCTLRLFDTYGPNDTRPKIFNLWAKIAETGESLDMSPGEQVIDISHVDDIVGAFLALAKLLQNNDPKVNNGSIYAVKADKRFSLKELAKIFEESVGKKLNINWGGRSYREREVMIPWENSEVVPGWVPKVDIRSEISKLITLQ